MKELPTNPAQMPDPVMITEHACYVQDHPVQPSE